MSEYLWDQYIDQVLSGEIITCETVRLAVERHVQELEKSESPDYPFYFDEKKARAYLRFIQCLRLIEGEKAGEFFPVLPWMAFIIACINGWRLKKNRKVKRFYRSLIMVAKKNAKTTLAAALAIASFILDNEARAQIYFAASVRDQASHCFEFAKEMVIKLINDSTAINSIVDVLKYNISHKKNGSFMRVISSDRNSVEGVGGHWITLDELHVLKSDDLYNNLLSSMGARVSPHIFCISTAGDNLNGFCHRLQKVCEDILRGIKEDERTFSMIYQLDQDDMEDWANPDNWIKANPSLGYSKRIDFMENESQAAKNEGASKEIDFKTKHLNLWVATHSTWIQDHIWMKAGSKWDESILVGRPCYSGLDLSHKHDLTALVHLFPPWKDDDKWRVKGRYWIPQENIKKRSIVDGVPYLEWERDGYIIPTPGDYIDLEFIEKEIRDSFKIYNIKMIEFDQFRASDMVLRLQEEGLPFEPFPQYARYFHEPIQFLYDLVLNQKIDHGNDPVLRWMAGNIHLVKDSNDNEKFSKSHSKERIDGMVALAMAVAGKMTDKSNKGVSVYAQRYKDGEDGLTVLKHSE